MNLETTVWTNCHADVATAGHSRIVAAYMQDVIDPSLTALNAQVQAWGESTEEWAPFAHSDAEKLLRATIESFCLSIQSLWERQLRDYLAGCAQQLRSDEKLASYISRMNWGELIKVFQDLRGISLEDFDSFPDLDLLQLLANACRHGDGKSARDLFKRNPELWPTWCNEVLDGMEKVRGGELSGTRMPSFNNIAIPPSMLRRFADAIIWFWDDAEYVYINSLKSKHPSVYSKLAKMREDRANRHTQI